MIRDIEELVVDLRVAGKEVLLVSSHGSLGSWPIDEVEVVRMGGDAFRLDLNGEVATFLADDVIAFSYEGMPVIQAEHGRFRSILRRWDLPTRLRWAGAQIGGAARLLGKQVATGAKRVWAAAAGLPVDRAARATGSTLRRTGQALRAQIGAVAAWRPQPLTGRREPKASPGALKPKPEVALRPRPSAAEESGMRPTAVEAFRAGGKLIFAAADLVLGHWPGPRLLIYHQIGTFHGRQMEVDEETFVAHLDWLETQGSVRSLADALAGRSGPEADRTFVLTFDDGYADLFDTAFPHLEERGFPFTLYLATGHVERGEPMAEGRTPLSWEQVVKMAESGLMTLGAHSHKHFDLRAASLGQIEEDLALCDLLIEERTGVEPEHFAYPWGFWSPVADTVVRQRYGTAALGGGPSITAETDPFLLHRLPIQRSDGRFFFKRKVLRGMRLEESVRRSLRGYEGAGT